MNYEPNSYYLSKEEPVRSCLLTLRNIIIEQNSKITEATKYGMPCFCFGKKILCYLWTDKKTDEPYILIVEGNRLIHPQLVTGNRSRMKILRVDPGKDLDLELINEILLKAISLYE